MSLTHSICNCTEIMSNPFHNPHSGKKEEWETQGSHQSGKKLKTPCTGSTVNSCQTICQWLDLFSGMSYFFIFLYVLWILLSGRFSFVHYTLCPHVKLAVKEVSVLEAEWLQNDNYIDVGLLAQKGCRLGLRYFLFVLFYFLQYNSQKRQRITQNTPYTFAVCDNHLTICIYLVCLKL